MTAGSASKVAACIENSNFIGKMTLNVAGITPDDMDVFLSENKLDWAVQSLGEWLGDIAVFFRAGNEQTKENELSLEELQEIKRKYFPSLEEIAAIEKDIKDKAIKEMIQG